MQKHLHIPYASPLADYVTSIWEVEGKQNITETILPKGIIEVIFNFGDRISGNMAEQQNPFSASRCFVQGVNTRIIQAHYHGRHHLFGVRLHPHMVNDLLGFMPSEISNNIIDLFSTSKLFQQLWHQLAELESFSKRVIAIEKNLPGLSKNICSRSKELSSLFMSESLDGFQTVDELAKNVCYSTRQLSRVSQNLFGICAEELITYKKFLTAVNLIHGERRSLTDIAYSAGFYDQAHFCRVFKPYAGMTAKQYQKKKSELPFHIFS